MADDDRDASRLSESAQALTGQYANYFTVGFNAYEFVIDCGQYYPGEGDPVVHTRIITSPPYGAALLDVITDSVREYEQEHGAIRRPNSGGGDE